jgi:hypothetical protein
MMHGHEKSRSAIVADPQNRLRTPPHEIGHLCCARPTPRGGTPSIWGTPSISLIPPKALVVADVARHRIDGRRPPAAPCAVRPAPAAAALARPSDHNVRAIWKNRAPEKAPPIFTSDFFGETPSQKNPRIGLTSIRVAKLGNAYTGQGEAESHGGFFARDGMDQGGDDGSAHAPRREIGVAAS